jgi:hypothetical protein
MISVTSLLDEIIASNVRSSVASYAGSLSGAFEVIRHYRRISFKARKTVRFVELSALTSNRNPL